MKSHQKTVLLAILFSLASCDNSKDASSATYFGLATAKVVIAEVHYGYLSCYALNSGAKKECLSEQNNKYIARHRKGDNEYIQAFQFESEKQGFKRFLNNLKLPCESIKEGPQFVISKQAYLVKCIPDQQYLMQFDYNKKEWKIVMN